MTDLPSRPNLTVRQTLAEGWGLMRGNLEILALLVGLFGAVGVILLNPFVPWYAEISEIVNQPEPDMERAMALGTPAGLPLAMLGLILLSLPIIIAWVRIIGIERSAAFEGGVAQTARRMGMLAWRYLCYFGVSLIMLVILGILLLLATLVVTVIVGALGVPPEGVALVTGIVSMIIAYIFFLPLLLGLIISTATTAMDQGIGIFASLQLWLKNWWPITGAAIIVYVLQFAVTFSLSLVLGQQSTVSLAIALGFTILTLLVVYALVLAWLDHQR